ncbi:MAG: efflux RND transporter periplasmic adaptor subunit [Rikenellaceae bacterium]
MKYIYFFILPFLFCCKSHKTESSMPSLPCEVAYVSDTIFKNRMNFTGQIYPNNTFTLEPRINGYLVNTNFKKGAPVKKGDILFQIEPIQINTTLTQAEAQLSSAIAEQTRTQNNYYRAVPLAEINAISASSLDEYKASYLAAQSSVNVAKAELESARLNMGYTTITAPANGIIADTDVSIGDWVGTGTQYAVLAKIYDIDTIQVKLALAVNDYLTIRQRDSLLNPSYDNSNLISDVKITLSDGTEYPEMGVYDYTESEIDSSTGTIILNVKFANKSMVLKPNQFVKVCANIGSERSCVVVPQVSVVQTQGQSNVFVVSDDDVVAFRKVKLGATIGDDWIVESGLKKGDKVLTTGVTKVRTGQKITPIF